MIIKSKELQDKYNINICGVIHVGAHHGEELSSYIDLDIKNIILFEPIAQNFEQIKKNILKLNLSNNFIIKKYQMALGNTNKTTTMYLANNNYESSSILKPKKHLVLHPDIEFLETQEVELGCLDDFVCKGYNFLNLDVQGYELEVLKGAKETLKNIDYVYCEVNRDEVYENNAYITDIDEFLSLYGMVRVKTEWWNNSAWGDAFYVKKIKS